MGRIKLPAISLICIMLFILGLPFADSAFCDYKAISDHDSVKDFMAKRVPKEWLDKAKSELHIAYGHTSHGAQIVTGMTSMTAFINGGGLGFSVPGEYPANYFSWNNGGTGGALDIRDKFAPGDAGDYLTWPNDTRAYLIAHPEINVVIWGWCSDELHWYSEQYLHQRYLDPMAQLEEEFPDVIFVYNTGVSPYPDRMERGVDDPTSKLNAQRIRDYCRANNKVLYDFYAIEHYNPDGEYFEFAADNCNYYEFPGGPLLGNWATGWQNSHTVNVEWYNCESGHSYPLNANQKAYAAWYLWARLAGWDGNTNTVTGANLNADPNDELVIDLGTNGIWIYSTATNTWDTLHPISSSSIIKANLDSDPTDDLVIDFGQYGIWIYSNKNLWTNLHNINPDTLIKANLNSGPKDDLIVDFGQYGLWIYSNNNTWSQLHTLNPDTTTNADLDSDNTDELVIDFGANGIWAYYPNLTAWQKLHALNPDSIIRASLDSNPIDDLIIDFGTNGIWIYLNNSTWVKLHTLSPDSITKADIDSDTRDDLVIDFGPMGIWIYLNNSSWVHLHTLNPESITKANLDSDTRDDLVIDFGSDGIWIYYNNNTWVKIHE